MRPWATIQAKVILFHGFYSKSYNHFLQAKSIIQVLLFNTNNEICIQITKDFYILVLKLSFLGKPAPNFHITFKIIYFQLAGIINVSIYKK